MKYKTWVCLCGYMLRTDPKFIEVWHEHKKVENERFFMMPIGQPSEYKIVQSKNKKVTAKKQ